MEIVTLMMDVTMIIILCVVLISSLCAMKIAISSAVQTRQSVNK